jgi:hypothetical protein
VLELASSIGYACLANESRTGGRKDIATTAPSSMRINKLMEKTNEGGTDL